MWTLCMLVKYIVVIKEYKILLIPLNMLCQIMIICYWLCS